MNAWYRMASYLHDFFSAALFWALILALYFRGLQARASSLEEIRVRTRGFLLRLGLWSLFLTGIFGAVRLWDFTGRSGAPAQSEAYGLVEVKHLLMITLLAALVLGLRARRTREKP